MKKESDRKKSVKKTVAKKNTKKSVKKSPTKKTTQQKKNISLPDIPSRILAQEVIDSKYHRVKVALEEVFLVNRDDSVKLNNIQKEIISKHIPGFHKIANRGWMVAVRIGDKIQIGVSKMRRDDVCNKFEGKLAAMEKAINNPIKDVNSAPKWCRPYLKQFKVRAKKYFKI